MSDSLTKSEDLHIDIALKKHLSLLSEKLYDIHCSALKSKSHRKEFSKIFHVGKSAPEMEPYLLLGQALAPHCSNPIDFGFAIFYPVRVKCFESECFAFVDASFSYNDAVQMLSMASLHTTRDSLKIEHRLPSEESYTCPDASCFHGIIEVDGADSCSYVGSLVFGAVASTLSLGKLLTFPLAVDISSAEDTIYIGSRPSQVKLKDLGPAFSRYGESALLQFPDTSMLWWTSQFGEHLTVPVKSNMAIDVQSRAGAGDGFSMRVHVPACCVASDTHLSVFFPRLTGVPSKEWLLQPFRICFSDGSQPLRPIQIYAKTARSVKFERLELYKWSEEDFEPPIELLQRKPGRTGEMISAAYFALDDPTSIYIEIDHLCVFQFQLGRTLVEFDAGDIHEKRPFSRGYDNDRENWITSFRRGPEKYILPAKFCRTALNIGDFTPFEDWAVAYHGTEDLQKARSIINGGFRLPASVRPGHIPLTRTFRGIANWGRAVFLSPSHKYCMKYGQLVSPPGTTGAYARTGTVNLRDEMIFALIQCRVRPRGYLKTATTTEGWCNCDSRASDEEIEYRVPLPQDVKPYGLLLRAVPYADVHRVIHSADLV